MTRRRRARSRASSGVWDGVDFTGHVEWTPERSHALTAVMYFGDPMPEGLTRKRAIELAKEWRPQRDAWEAEWRRRGGHKQ
jgi:hypothetical protein